MTNEMYPTTSTHDDPASSKVKIKSPYVIAVCHQKGGVAKTTTVSALGATLAEHGQRVLLVDLDPSGNLTSGLGLSPLKMRKSAADILLGNEGLTSVRQQTVMPGLDIVPSNTEMRTVSRFLYLRPKYEYVLQSCFDQHANNGLSTYDYVMMDCPPTLGPLTIAALTASNLVIVPTQCEYYSLQALEAVFKVIATVRAETNPALHFRLLITMFDRRGSLHARILELVRQRYAPALFETMIGFDSKLRESQLMGLPVVLHAPGTRATEQYRALAEELCAYVQSKKVPQPA